MPETPYKNETKSISDENEAMQSPSVEHTSYEMTSSGATDGILTP